MVKYLVIFEKTKNGYSAYIPDLPGCVATGRTRKQVEKYIYEAIKLHLDALRKEKLPIPEPRSESELLVFA